MTDSRSNYDSDDEVLSPYVGKRLKLEATAVAQSNEASSCRDKSVFSEFLRREEVTLLKNCRNCLAELFFLESGTLIDYFNRQEESLSNPGLQKFIEEFEKSLLDQTPSSSVNSIEALLSDAPHLSEPPGHIVHRPTNISVPELSPRNSVVSPKSRLLSPIPAVPITGHSASPARGSCSPLSPSRQTRHLSAETAAAAASEAPVSIDQTTGFALAPVALTPQPASSPAPQSLAALKELQEKENAAERAKHDADILRRVAELQRDGLWSAKRLPRCAEPSRPKCHWDSLLEEMVWMSTDFAEEKRWKKAVAKKIAQAVCKHVTETGLNITLGCDEASNEASEDSPEDVAIRTCRSIAVMVEEFWTQMLRIASWRIESRMAEKHKRERDMHLDFIVGQTEKFSSWLSEGLIQPPIAVLDKDSAKMSDDKPTTPEANTLSSVVTGKDDEDDDDSKDDEFVPEDAGDEMDDEETIAREEAAGEGGHAEEVNALCAEAEMGVDELLASLPPEYLSQLGLKEGVVSQASDSSGLSSSSRRRDAAAAAESAANQTSSFVSETTDSDIQKEKEQQPQPIESAQIEETKVVEGETSDSTSRRERLDKLAAVASSMQPGSVNSTTRTPVPFLIRGGDLREYQLVGLDWLVMLHEKHINGILADEMGLGKTIQTIALLAHLACVKGIWGPHIIIVPASVLLNWEMEFKRWLPAFKVLTYYGSVKERREKRRGWTDPNAFHVCITSYQLAVIDHSMLRRRRWQYLILDEAQNIKNFRSRRWQALLSMQSQHRLLLTGTPLQNSLMELWSLMHFLMPQLFQSSDDFRDWFANPLASMVEGDREFSENLVQRLHKVLRPFLLRRLKKDVERQLPSKYEHIVSCRLSRRQRFLYDDFMSRASTRAVLQGGQFVSVLGVLVQLRKVCNHPDLFEPRPVISPLVMPDPLVMSVPFLLAELQKNHPVSQQTLEWLIGEHVQQPSLCGIDFDRRAELCPSQQTFYNAYTSPVSTDVLLSRNEALNDLVQRRIRLQAFRALAGDLPVATDIEVHDQDLVKGGGRSVGRLVASSQLRPPEVVYPLKWSQEAPPDLTNGSLSGQEQEQQKPFADVCSRLEVTDANAIATPPVDVIRRVCAEENETAIFLAKLNEQRCRLLATRPLFGSDLIHSVSAVAPNRTWRDSFDRINKLNISIDENEMSPLLQLFAFSLYPVLAQPPVFYSGLRCSNAFAPQQELSVIKPTCTEVMPIDRLQHTVAIRKRLNFPELRLIQYDCGKLQSLASLLRALRSDDHRVLIFTQMSRMLDVLEQFLSYHGFAYLRLDGSTKLENRQVLVERFNQDKRIFCFILSTRAGGLGINLTGADTVIFYDSDWNPTTDAQAQDRCHRIGQTRDVHIYRLVSERTVEENVIKRAAQKRLLNELAIEGGDFTTARLRENALREIFGPALFDDVPATAELASIKPATGDDENTTTTAKVAMEDVTSETDVLAESAPTQQIVAFEEALLQAEGATAGDEADVAAARQARREQVAENADNDFFLDPDLPVPGSSDQPGETRVTPLPPPPPPVSAPVIQSTEQPKDEVSALEQQLRPVERLALDIVERFIVSGQQQGQQQQQQQQQQQSVTSVGEPSNEPPAEMDATLRSEWELERLKSVQLNLAKKTTAGSGSTSDECSESETDESESDGMDATMVGNDYGSELALTYDRTAGQAWIDDWSGAVMPVWLPPTPPSELQMDGSSLLQMDEFCEGCMCCCDDFDALATSLSNPSVFLYHAVPMFESELPPVCIQPPAAPMLSRIRAAILAASPQVTRVPPTGEDAIGPNAHRVPGDSIVSSLLADQISLPTSTVGHDITAKKPKSQSRKRAGASLADDCPSAPRSPFERPTAALLRVRDEMQRIRRHLSATVLPLPPGSILVSGKADQRASHAGALESAISAQFSLANALSRFSPLGNDWLISEEWGILLALSNLMDVPTSLTPVQPGHIANWDAIADFITTSAVGPFRAAKSCRQHYDSTILPREDARQQQPSTTMDAMLMLGNESGRPTPPPGFGQPIGKKRADKRRQQQMMAEQQPMPAINSSERTAAMNAQDSGASVTGYHLTRFTAALEAMGRFQPHCPHVPSSRSGSVSRPFAAHCPLLSDIDWDNAMMPVDVAAHRQAARQSRRLQQHFQIQQQQQQHHHQSLTQPQQPGQAIGLPQQPPFVPGSASRSSLGAEIPMPPMDTTGTPQHGRALSDLVKSRNIPSASASSNVTVMQTGVPGQQILSSGGGSLVDSLLISTPPLATANLTVAMSHSYTQQQQQQQPQQQVGQSQQQQQQIIQQQHQQQSLPSQTTPQPPIVRQQSASQSRATTATPTPNSAVNVTTAANRPGPNLSMQSGDGSSVTRLLSAPSPSVGTIQSQQQVQQSQAQVGAVQQQQQQTPTVYASRGAAILSPASSLAPSPSPAPNSTIINAVAPTSTPTIRQAATPTARLQLMPSSGGLSVTSSPVTRVASNVSGNNSGAGQTTTGGPSQQVAQLRLQVAASAAQAAINRSNSVTAPGAGNVGGNSGDVVSVVVTGTPGSGNTFATGTLRGTPVEALLRRSPTVLSTNTIRGQGGMRHITQLLPPSATGFVTVQQQQQQQQQPQQTGQIVSISSAGPSVQNASVMGQPAATIVLSAAGPAGNTHAYSQFRSSPQPRPGLTAFRYADASGISSVRLAGGASVSAASVVPSPFRQQMTAVRPSGSVLTVATAISAPPAAATAQQTPATTLTATPASVVSASSASSGQQQASPPVHLVATHQLPSSTIAPPSSATPSAASSSTPTLSNALTGGRVSMPTLTLGNTTSRLQQQLDTPNVVVSSDEEDESGNNAGGADDDSGEGFTSSQSVALPPTRGRPPTRRLQRGNGTTRGGSTRGAASGGGSGGANKQANYRRH